MPSVWIKKTSIFALAFILTACGQAMDKTNAQTISEQNLQKGQEFLAQTAKVPGVSVLPSGVMYKIVSRSPNPGAQPTVADNVTINYEGKLLDGSVFDSSFARNEPANFPLGRLISAWQQVIPLMHVGDEIILYTPPTSAYGERDLGEIPPNSTLIFRVQLLGINQ
jgi:peptidylprolyl isomerase/FKBP-type peptidyl-prolyl cis-trans isomerase FklB|nr:FKBP-type peptidyl-prolyl cis-trans isomerase [Asticcacaulis taihuensis]